MDLEDKQQQEDPQDDKEGQEMADPNVIMNTITNGIMQMQNLLHKLSSGPFRQTPLQTNLVTTLDLNTKDGHKY